MGTETRRRTIIYDYKSYVNRRLVTKEEMCGEKNLCKACASVKKILQTSGLKKKNMHRKFFTDANAFNKYFASVGPMVFNLAIEPL